MSNNLTEWKEIRVVYLKVDVPNDVNTWCLGRTSKTFVNQ